MCSFFWTETIWNRFSGLKIRGRYLEKIQEKNQEIFKVLNLSKIILKCPNVFWSIFFEKKIFPSVPWKFESSKNFKNPKRPKIVHKSIQTCFEHVLRRFLWKSFFAQCSMESSKIFEKSQIFQISKNAQNRSQFWRNLLWTCFGAIFAKNSFAQCSTDGRAFENFQNNQINIKIHKLLLIVSKSVQTCLRAIFLENFFCSLFHGFIESFRKKTKNIQNTKNAQNRSQKCPNVFWTCFMAIFLTFFAQCSKQGFSDFLDLKTWVLFYETILNKHSFCIHAIVNKRNPFPNFLDLKLWVQIPELETMCSVFWTETIWNRFCGLKIRGRYLKKIQEKSKKVSKF